MSKASEKPKRILIVLHVESSFPELSNVGRLLKRSEGFEPVFLFDERYYPDTLRLRDAQILNDEGITVLNALDTYPDKAMADSLKYNLLLKSIPEKLLNRLKFIVYYSLFYQLIENLRIFRFIDKLLRKENISFLILGLDLVQYNSSIYIKAAHRNGIKSVIITDMMTGPQEFGALYYNNPLHQVGVIGSLFFKLFPNKWVIKYRKRYLWRLPSVGMIMARELLGLAPSFPWQIHSGSSDLILVDSKVSRNIGVENGLPGEKLLVTGTISQDLIAASTKDCFNSRREFYRVNGYGEDRPMILLAMPQDDHPKGYSRHFQTHRDMVDFLVQATAACKGYNVSVCLHPSLSSKDLKYIESRDLKISRDHTYQIIPLCDIFVATVSSTIKWAIACGKPVIMYDYNHHRRGDFLDAEGVLAVEEKEEFLQAISKLTQDNEFYRSVALKQQGIREKWGVLDGRAGERMLDVIRSMAG